MKTLSIYGDNRFETHTQTRIACRGVVFKDDLLLLSYAARLDLWMLPGGGMKPNEDDEACCVRELAEETGVLVKPQKHFLTLHEYYEEYLYITHFFTCSVLGATEQHLTENEKKLGLETRYLPFEEALSIFAAHSRFAAEEEKRGFYLREYTALSTYLESI